ncbi:MAG TPA: tyrosine-type recombinase/integrase [Acidimicrobiia bacterium]|nr:tyrosine-type recombinase/integrase [Acidimicrobiia bacterium]
MSHPTDAAMDARGRLIVSLLAEDRLSYREVAALTDADVDPAAGTLPPTGPGRARRVMSEHTRLALAAYLAEREAGPGPLIRSTRSGGPLTVRWLEDLVRSWKTGLDRRKRLDAGGDLHRLARQYLAERKTAGQLSAVSVPNLESTLMRFADTVDGRTDVDRRNVETWIGRAGLAPATRRRELSVLRSFWRWLIVTGRADHDPTVGVSRPKEPRRLPRGLQADQVAAVLDACRDSRARLMVTLMVQLGLRACEVSRLRLEDIDRHDQTVMVTGKGGHQRLLPIVDEAADAIATYLAEWPATRGPLVRSYNDPGKALCATYVAKSVADIMRAAGVSETGHSLRHTAASDVLKRGIDIETVSAMLGHANVATTSRYLPLVVTPLRDAMEGRTYQ